MNLFKNEIEIVLCEEKQKEILTEKKTSDQSENIFIKTATTCKTKGRKTQEKKDKYKQDKQRQTMV